MDKLVTVIIPSLEEREEQRARCIRSVEAQTYKLHEYKVGIDQNRQGPAWVRNRLVELVDTPFISFLDDDDEMLPDHLELHMQYADDYDVIFSWGTVVHPGGGTALFDSDVVVDRILAGHNTLPVTATVRTELFRQVGGFSETERFEDWYLWKCLIGVGARFKKIEKATWNYNITPEARNSKE